MAQKKIQGLTVALNCDTSGVTKGLGEVGEKSKATAQNLANIEKLLKLDPTNTELVAERQKLLQDAVTASSQKLEMLKSAQADVNKAFQEGKISDKEYIAFQQAVLYAERDLEKFKNQSTQTETPLQALEKTISEQKKSLSQLEKEYQNAVLAEGKNSASAQALKQQYQQLDSELKANQAQLKSSQTAASSLSAEEQKALTPLESLEKTISEQKKSLSQLEKEYQNAVLAEGENSDSAKALKQQYQQLDSELKTNQAQLKSSQTAASSLSAEEQKALTPLESLEKTISEQKKSLSQLEKEYQNAVLAEGENSESAKALKQQYQQLDSELKANQSQLKSVQTSASQLTAEEQKALTPVEALKKSISDQQKELDRLSEEYKNVVLTEGKNSESAKALESQMKTLTSEQQKNQKELDEVEDATKQVTGATENLSKKEDETTDTTKNLSDAVKNAGDNLSTAAVAVGTFIGNLATDAVEKMVDVVKQLAESSIEAGKSFGSASSQIAATLGYTVGDLSDSSSIASQNLDLLKQKAREMGAATSFSATEAAEGLNVLAMMGFDVETSMNMVETTLRGAEAGGMAIAESAQYVGGALKGFKEQTAQFADSAEAATYYTDLMAKGATMAATNVPQLGQALSGIAATANTYKQNADSVTVSLLRLAEQGEVGSGAATALVAAMKNLYSPTDTAKKALDSLGVQAYDEAGNIRDFNTIVGELDKSLNDLGNDQLKNDLENQIFGIQGQAAFDKMVVTSGDKLQGFYDGIANASGSASQQAETMMDNLQGDITKMESAFSELQLSIFDYLDKPLRDSVQIVTNEFLPALTGMVQGTEGADEQLKLAFEHASEQAGKMVDSFAEVLGVSEQWKKVKDFAHDAFDKIHEPAQQAFDRIKEFGENAKEKIKLTFQNMEQPAKDAFGKIKSSVADAKNRIKASFDRIKEVFQPAIDKVDELKDKFTEYEESGQLAKDTFQIVGDAVSRFVDIVAGAVEKVADFTEWFYSGSTSAELLKGSIIGITTAFATFKTALAIQGAITVVTTAISALPAVLTTVKGAIAGVNAVISANPIGLAVAAIAGLVAAIVYLWNNCEEYRIGVMKIIDDVKGAWDWLKKGVGNAIEFMKGYTDYFKNEWNSNAIAIKAIGQDVKNGFENIKDGIKTHIDSIKENIQKLKDKWNDFKDNLNLGVDAIKNKVNEFKTNWQAGADTIQQYVQNVKDKWNDFKDTWSSGVDTIKNKVNEFKTNWQAGVDTINDYIQRVKDKWNDFKDNWNLGVDAIKDGINRIKEHISSIPDKFNEVLGNARTWGTDLINNFVGGIRDKIGAVQEVVTEVADKVKDFLGFSEPDEGPLSKFHTFAPDMMELFAEGIKQNENLIAGQFEKSLANIGINADLVKMPVMPSAPVSSTANNTVNLNVTVHVDSISDSYGVQKMTDQIIENVSSGLAELQARQNSLIGVN